jgi:hypothetical protein
MKIVASNNHVTMELNGDDVANKETMEKFQKFMDELTNIQTEEIKALASELGVSNACAADVSYLRSRSRWTIELEKELIRLHITGEVPNMCEFGHPSKN